MKNTLKIFIGLIIIIISNQGTYAELPGVTCKIQGKVIYLGYNTNIEKCYNINNVIIESNDKIYFLNSLNIINKECLSKKQNSIAGEINYADIQSFLPKIGESYTFKVIGASLISELPDSLIISYTNDKESFSGIKDCWWGNINKEELSFNKAKEVKKTNIIYKYMVFGLILGFILALIFKKIKKQD